MNIFKKHVSKLTVTLYKNLLTVICESYRTNGGRKRVFKEMSIPAREKYYQLGGPNAKMILEQLVKNVEEIAGK